MAKATKKVKTKSVASTPKKVLTWEQSKNIFLTKCTTKQELKNFIKYFFELELPDTTVSRHADTNPYDIVWEMYNICVNKNNPENIQELLYVASRGAGKTLGMAIAELLILIHDQRDCVHLGAILSQAKRCYSYQQKFLLNSKIKPIVSPPDLSDDERILGKCNMEKSTFNLPEGKVTIEVLPTTLKAVNGPHVPLVVCISGSSLLDIMVDDVATQQTASTLHDTVRSGIDVKILSYKDGLIEYQPILDSYNNGIRSTIKIETNKGYLICTPEHLIWNANLRCYTEAKDLQHGDLLLEHDGDYSTVSSVTNNCPTEVFDFKVADNHNFFANGKLVHNCDELDTLSGESRKAHKDVSGMLDSRGDKKALRVGISTRKSRYGLMNQSMENAEKEGRTVRKWTVLEFSQKCPDSRSGTNPTSAYYNQDTLEVLSEREWGKKDKVAQNEYLSTVLPGEGCVKCPLAALCLGDAKLQTSKSPMLKPIGDAIKKAIESGPDWAISQLFNLKPSVEGIVYKEFEEKTHVKTWNQMWRTLTSTDYPGECTHDIFVKKCRQMKLQCVGGVDWGWSNPSTLVVMYIDNQENVYVVRTDARTYYNNPSWVAHIKNTWHNTYGIQLYFPDLANPGDGQLMREAGLPCPDKVEKNIHDGTQVVKKWLRSLAHPLPKLFIAKETNQFLINEFSLYHFETDAAGEITDKPDTEHDHALDALRYMMFGTFGKAGLVTANYGLEMANEAPTDARGHYLRAPTAAEFAQQNGMNINEDQSLSNKKLGEVGTLAQLTTEDEDSESSAGGSFLWSF